MPKGCCSIQPYTFMLQNLSLVSFIYFWTLNRGNFFFKVSVLYWSFSTIYQCVTWIIYKLRSHTTQYLYEGWSNSPRYTIQSWCMQPIWKFGSYFNQTIYTYQNYVWIKKHYTREIDIKPTRLMSQVNMFDLQLIMYSRV